MEQVGYGRSLNEGALGGGRDSLFLFSLYQERRYREGLCFWGGVTAVGLSEDSVRLCPQCSVGGCFWQRLTCECAYVHTSSVCLLYMVSARLHFASITFSMCQASCLLRERLGLDKADWWGLRDTMVNWSQQVAVNSFLPGLFIILPVSLLAKGLRCKLSAIVQRSNFLIKEFRS